MRIVTLMENSPGLAGCAFEHGLSFYVETERRRILSDTGASAAFLDNAALLGIPLETVDAVFLSHGHYDHAGGVLPFVERNPRAVIYVQRTAELPYYAMDEDGFHYIGMNPEIAALPQIRFLDGDADIDEELSVLGHITGRRFWPASNRSLKRLDGGTFAQDSFSHEQALVVRQSGRFYLFSGCAHNGILNVLDRFREKYGRNPSAVFSGFHFMKRGDYAPEELTEIRETARELSRMDTEFYSGHCTGQRAFALMREIMGGQLHELHSGLEIPVRNV